MSLAPPLGASRTPAGNFRHVSQPGKLEGLRASSSDLEGDLDELMIVGHNPATRAPSRCESELEASSSLGDWSPDRRLSLATADEDEAEAAVLLQSCEGETLAEEAPEMTTDEAPTDQDPDAPCADAVETASGVAESAEAALASERLGVSVAFLAEGFLQEVEAVFGEDADPNYHEINGVLLFGEHARGANVQCPRDGRPGSSYVDALDPEFTGSANVMLSWCWSYGVRTVVSSLIRWCEQTGRDPRQTFVWQCALCCNQYRVEEKKARGESEDFAVFEHVFESRVRATQHVLALLDPWDEPLYINRIWCIFELWKAMNIEGCVLEVILPEMEELRFKDALRSDGVRAMWKAFENLRIQDAQASVEADRVNILRLVDPEASSPEALDASERCATLNREVVQRLQAWCVDTAAAHAEWQISEENALGTTGFFAGNLLIEAADFERAEAILSAARSSMEAVGAEETHGYLVLLRHEAELRNRMGHYEEASELIARVLAGLENESCLTANRFRALLTRRFEYPRALSCAGEIAKLRGQLTEAVDLLERARVAFEVAGAEGAHGHTDLVASLATCLCRQGRHTEAEELLRQCLSAVDIDVDGIGAGASGVAYSGLTPELARLLAALGRCRLGQGRHAEALEFLARARRIFEDNGAVRAADYGILLSLLGACYSELESPEQAESLFDKATLVLEDVEAITRIEYLTLPLLYAQLHLREGRLDDAERLLGTARAAVEAAGATETPEFGRVLLALGRCQLQKGCGSEAVELFNEAKLAFEAAGASDAFAHLALLGS